MTCAVLLGGLKASQAEQQPRKARALRSDSGMVLQADPSQLVVQRPGDADLRLAVERDTRVTVAGERANTASLTPGAAVRVTYRVEGSRPIAVTIDSPAEGLPIP